MKLSRLIALASITISTVAAASQDRVQFEVVLMREGKVISSPKVVGEFGKSVALVLGDVMRFEGSASIPDYLGYSTTSVKLYLYESGEINPPKEMSMSANLTKTPSFEYSVPGTNARFVVKPRLVKSPE